MEGRIMKINLKKKVMLMLLASGILSNSGALAGNTFNLNDGSGEQNLANFDPTLLPKTGNIINFNLDTNYNGLTNPGPQPLVGAFDDSGSNVVLSGHVVNVTIGASVEVLQNINGGIVGNGTVTETILNVTGGKFATNYYGSCKVDDSHCLGIIGGYAKDGSVVRNTVTITDLTCYIAGGGFARCDSGSGLVSENTINVYNCNLTTADSYLIGGAATDFFNSSSGGNVLHNTVNIYSGTFEGNVYGGTNWDAYSSGGLLVIANGINIYGGTFTSDWGIYGGYRCGSSNAKDNYVIIHDGDIKVGRICGIRFGGSAEGNYIIIEGGTFDNYNGDYISIIGADDIGYAKKNYVKITGGIFKNAQIKGASGYDNSTVGGDSVNDGNSVIVNNMSFEAGTANEIIGGYANGSNATVKYNSVIINNGTFTEASSFGIEIVGGKASGTGTATYNSVDINGGTFIANGTGKITITGGDAISIASNNSVTIKNGVFQGAEIIGGQGENVTYNKVIIDGGTFNGTNDNKIYGACTTGMAGLVDNEVVLNGGIFSKATIVAAEGDASAAGGNKIIIAAGSNALDLSGATLMGYETGSNNNRTLNVNRTNVKVGDIKNFGTINFTLPEGATSDDIVLKMGAAGSAYDLSNLGSATINVSGITLADGDYITLMQNVSSTGFTNTGNIKILDVGGGKYDLIYYTGTTAPAQAKADYTITHGGDKLDSSGHDGNTDYNAISGNSDLSSAGLTDWNMIVRRGQNYNGEIKLVEVNSGSGEQIENNTLTINDGTFNKSVYAAYYNGLDGDGDEANHNTLYINGGTFEYTTGSIFEISAGKSMQHGDVTFNKIYINDGDFGIQKKISGGYVNDDGNALDNEIHISNGNFGGATGAITIYGGYSQNGSIQRNKVDIAGGNFKSTNNSDSGYCYVQISGARSLKDGCDIGENEVNIFGGSFEGTIRIYGGQGSSNSTLLYNKVYIDSAIFDLTSISQGNEIDIKGAHATSGVARYNGITISNTQFKCDETSDRFNIYGAAIFSTSDAGLVEYNYVTLYDGTYNKVYGGYIEKGNANNNQVNIYDVMGRQSCTIYSGYTKEGDVVGNKLAIYGGDFASSSKIVAGYSENGSIAYGNVLRISGGNFNSSICGGECQYGSAKNNIIEVTGGKFSAGLYAGMGYMEITGNHIFVSDVEFEGSLTAGRGGIGVVGGETDDDSNTVTVLDVKFGDNADITAGSGRAEIIGNKVIVSSSEFGYYARIYGAHSVSDSSGNAIKNKVDISESKFLGGARIYGSGKEYNGSGNSEANVVNIVNTDFGAGNKIFGGYASNGDAGGDAIDKGNVVNIINSTMGTNTFVYGGNASGNANYNSVNIYGGRFNGDPSGVKIYGGYSSAGNANFNTVNIDGGDFLSNIIICGGQGSVNANNNMVNIIGGTFEAVKIYGGNCSGGASNNTVEISSGTFNTNGFQLFGGTLGAFGENNTLNLKIKMGGKADSVACFQRFNFTLPSGILSGEVMLKTNSLAVDQTGSSSAEVNVYASNNVFLRAGETITLIESSTLPQGTFVGGDVLNGAGEVNLVGNNLILTLLHNFDTRTVGSEDQQKAPVEGMAAAVQTVNMSADLASGQGMASLVANTADGTTNTFGAMSSGQSKYKTGSHVDVDGWGLLVGAGKTKEWKNGTATTYGLFFEYGKGDFDTYNGDVHGDGDSENKGVGIMVRHKLKNNTYYEGNIRYGKQKTEWSESELGSYDTDSKYYGIMVGMGHIFPAGKNEIDVYGRYTFGHVGACDATVGDSHYNFESVKSHRVRLGAKYNFVQEKSNAKPFIGLAWEHEFKGESKASIAGVGEAPAPSMKGHTGIFELGCDWDVSKKWTLGLGANAYIGKRKGWDGTARVFYNF